TVTVAPTAPDVTDKLVMLGAGTTVKFTPLLAWLDTVTTTFPVVAPLGTVTAILDEPHVVTEAVVPLNVTVLVPCEEPNDVPVIVTAAPTAPVVIDKLVIAGTTVKFTPLLAWLDTVTTTFPVVAPLGTVTPMLNAPHDVTVAVVPLNVTVPAPCELPKFDPVTVTAAPTAPVVTDKLAILGAGTTVKFTPLLGWLDTVTTTFPVVAPLGTVTAILDAPHDVTVAVVPLNLAVLVPCVEPNVVPVIVTAAPIAPVVIDKLVMAGAGPTVRPEPSRPPPVTSTFPVAALLGPRTPVVVPPRV